MTHKTSTKALELEDEKAIELGDKFAANGAVKNNGVSAIEDEENGEEGEKAEPLSPEAALEHLLTLGKKQGFVSYDDVLKVMPEAESNMDQLEDAFRRSSTKVSRSARLEKAKAKRAAEDDKDNAEPDAFDLSQIEIDDSISLYLKEIGRVPLLTAAGGGFSGQTHGTGSRFTRSFDRRHGRSGKSENACSGMFATASPPRSI